MSTLNGDRFSPITADNHAGSLWIATLLALVYSVLVLGVRSHQRWKMYGPDDWLAAAATLLQLGEVIATIVALKHGIGKSLFLLSAADRSTASRATYASQILFIIACCLAKWSTLSLMMRLFNLKEPKQHVDRRSAMLWWVCAVTAGIVGLWTVLSIVAVTVNCSAYTFIQTSTDAHCPDQLLRWQLVAAFDVVTEVALVLISILIVYPVKLSFELKSQVVLAFAFRLPVAALAILHLHFIGDYIHAANPGLAIVPVLIVQQMELCWSLISATIPNLKSFVKQFSSGFGLTIDLDLNAAHYGKGTNKAYGSRTGAEYELGSVGRSGHSQMASRHGREASIDSPEGRPTAVHAPPLTGEPADGGASIESDGSQDHIIRKDIQWKIHYENEQ